MPNSSPLFWYYLDGALLDSMDRCRKLQYSTWLLTLIRTKLCKFWVKLIYKNRLVIRECSISYIHMIKNIVLKLYETLKIHYNNFIDSKNALWVLLHLLIFSKLSPVREKSQNRKCVYSDHISKRFSCKIEIYFQEAIYYCCHIHCHKRELLNNKRR